MTTVQGDAATWGMIVGFFIPFAVVIIIGAIRVVINAFTGG